MKKRTLTLLLLLMLVCTLMACADPSDRETPTDSDPVGHTPAVSDPAETTEAETTEAPPADTHAAETEAKTETEAVTEVETVAETETEAVTEIETVAETETEAETEAETTVDTPAGRYIRFPLTSADDATSYVSLPDMTAAGPKGLEFFLVPTDTDSAEPVLALRLGLPADGQKNIQVIAVRDGKSYGFLFMEESVYTRQDADGTEIHCVRMQCATLGFVSDKTMTVPATRYYYMEDGSSAELQYTDRNKRNILAQRRYANLAALRRAEDLFEEFSDPAAYEFTILYSYIDGVETVDTPVDALPSFPFDLFREHAFDN